MGASDIKLADQVRRVLGRHYINPRNVRIVAGRGNVRIIGTLERTGKHASNPIDEDTVSRLKSEIKHIKGVKTVAIDFDTEAAEAVAEKAKIAKPKSKEERKKAFADALKAAMEAKRKELFGVEEEPPPPPAKPKPKPPEKTPEPEPEKEQPAAEYKIPLDEEDIPTQGSAPPGTVETTPKTPPMEVKPVRYGKYQATAESSWNWTSSMAYDLLGEDDWDRFKEAHGFYRTDLEGHKDEDPPRTVEAYALPHHILKGGTLRTHWPGVVFAMAALLGEGSRINIPRTKKREIYDHLARHYKDELNKYPPELIEMAPPGKNYNECEPDELVEEPWGYADFKDYHEKQGINMWWLTLEAWKLAIGAEVFIGFDEKPAEEPQQRRSSRILRRISRAFRSGKGSADARLSMPVEKLLEAIDEVEVRLGQGGADIRAAEKLSALAGALRTFAERYSHASGYYLPETHADILDGLDKSFGRVFEHISSRSYSKNDMEALLGVVERLELLAKSKSRGAKE